jgi:phage shock protein PspC (stress-responsive transcriptional regulator)
MMNCGRCGKELESDSAYCRYCGAPRRESGTPRRLCRLPSQGRLGGVCAGIADYFDADVTLIRLGWVVLSIVPGALVGGILAYLAAWLLMPASSAPVAAGARSRLTRSPTDRMLGGVCGGIAEFIGIDSTIVRLAWAVLTIIPGAIVLGVIVYLVAWFIMPERKAPAMVAMETRA